MILEFPAPASYVSAISASNGICRASATADPGVKAATATNCGEIDREVTDYIVKRVNAYICGGSL